MMDAEVEPFVKLVRSERVQEGSPAVGRVGVKKIAVVRINGALKAFNDACPHAGSPLSAGTIARGTVTCRRHGWVFDLDTGACVEHPIYCLKTYEVRERNGWVEVCVPHEVM